jgi:hypothetical protein
LSDDDWSTVKMFDLPEESTLPVNLNLIYQEQAKYPLIQEMPDQLEKSLTILKQNKKLSKLQQFTILEGHSYRHLKSPKPLVFFKIC